MKNATESLLKAAEVIDCGNYALGLKDVIAILEKTGQDPFECAALAFRCGFVKGQRAVRKQVTEEKAS